jgi:hypothetical protein
MPQRPRAEHHHRRRWLEVAARHRTIDSAGDATDRDNLLIMIKMSLRGGNGFWWLGHICAALQNLNWGDAEWTVKVDGLDGSGNPMKCKF